MVRDVVTDWRLVMSSDTTLLPKPRTHSHTQWLAEKERGSEREREGGREREREGGRERERERERERVSEVS